MVKQTKTYAGNKKTRILLDLGFKLFTVDTIDIYKPYLKKMNGPTGSYMRIANIICWGFYSIPYYIEKDGFFIIVSDDAYYETFSVLAPIGDYTDTKSLKSVLEYIVEVCDRLEVSSTLIQAKDWMEESIKKVSGLSFDWSYSIDESDYIYSLEELKNSYTRRKTHYENKIQKFVSTFDPEVFLYKPEDYDACMDIIKEMYCDNNGCDSCVFGCMKVFYDTLITSLEYLGGEFLVFKTKGQVIAFVVFVDDEDLLYFDRKAPHSLIGFSEYLNELIIKRYGANYKTMNFEEDMGNEGLRRHKRALGPYELSHNYKVELKKSNG